MVLVLLCQFDPGSDPGSLVEQAGRWIETFQAAEERGSCERAVLPLGLWALERLDAQKATAH